MTTTADVGRPGTRGLDAFVPTQSRNNGKAAGASVFEGV